MVLKAGGSSPPIYPYMFQNSDLVLANKWNKVYSLHLINKYLLLTLISNFYINKKSNYLNYLFTLTNYSNLLSHKEILRTTTFLPNNLDYSIEMIKSKSITQKKLLVVTLKAVYFNLSISHEGSNVDYGFSKMHLTSNTNGLGIVSLRKFIKVYKLMINLLYNLFLYSIPFLVFSTPVMQLESSSFSWHNNTKIQTMWRYIYTSLFNNRNHVSLMRRNAFQLVSFLGINTAIITDTIYHNKTIAQVRRCRIYSVGLVPITLYSNNVDLVIPIGSSTLLNQYIFFRLLTIVKRSAIADNFLKLKTTWFNL